MDIKFFVKFFYKIVIRDQTRPFTPENDQAPADDYNMYVCLIYLFKINQIDFRAILRIKHLWQLQNVFEMRPIKANVTREFWRALSIIELHTMFG